MTTELAKVGKISLLTTNRKILLELEKDFIFKGLIKGLNVFMYIVRQYFTCDDYIMQIFKKSVLIV